MLESSMDAPTVTEMEVIEPDGRRSRAWRVLAAADGSETALVLLLPLLLIAVNASWIFTIAESIDPWVYFGYFENLPTYLRVFPGAYYGSRLSWILPGFAVHKMFSPLVANYVLHMAVYDAAIIAIYSTLRRTVGGRAAVLGSILAGTYSYFLSAVGWNYVDGAGIAYYALAVCGITAAADRCRRRGLAVSCAGMAAGGSIYSNLLWIVLMPPLLLYYRRITRLCGSRRPISDAVSFALGLAAVTVALGLANLSLGSDFLFFLPSVAFAATSVAQASPYRVPWDVWPFSARWLIFPAVALAATIVRVIVTRRGPYTFARVFGELYLATCLLFVALELAGRPVVQIWFTSSFVIPSMALAVGSELAPAVNRLTPRQYRMLIAGSLLLCVGTFARSVGSWIVHLNPYHGVAGPLVLLLVAAGVLVVSTKVWALATFLACTSIANVAAASSAFDFSGGHTRQDMYLATVAAAHVVNRLDPGASARFWYSVESPFGPVYLAIASTHMWGYRLVGTHFPSLWNPMTRQDAVIGPAETLVILADEPTPLVSAGASLSKLGLGAFAVATEDIAEGAVRFRLVVARTVVARHRLSEPIPVAADVFGPGRVPVAGARIAVDREIDAVEIVTNRSRYDWQIVSRSLPVTPHRQHVLEFELAISRGGAGVHIVDASNRVLASRYWCEPSGPITHQELVFEPGASTAVTLALSNCGITRPVVSHFAIRQIRLWSSR